MAAYRPGVYEGARDRLRRKKAKCASKARCFQWSRRPVEWVEAKPRGTYCQREEDRQRG